MITDRVAVGVVALGLDQENTPSKPGWGAARSAGETDDIAAILRPGGTLIGMTLVKGDSLGQHLIKRFFDRLLCFRFFDLKHVEQLIEQSGLRLEARTCSARAANVSKNRRRLSD